MTKNERIAKLEAEIEALKARIALLEARPIVLPGPWVGRSSHPDSDPTYPRCACGRSISGGGGYPVHLPITPSTTSTVLIADWDDLQWSYTTLPADILPGTADGRIP